MFFSQSRISANYKSPFDLDYCSQVRLKLCLLIFQPCSEKINVATEASELVLLLLISLNIYKISSAFWKIWAMFQVF